MSAQELKIMTKFAKLAVAMTGATLAAQAAFAGANNNNLILSINNNDGAGATEFTISLGQASTYTPVPNFDLSSFLSGYSSFASAGASGLNVGVAGGQNGQGGLSGAGNDVYTTTLRLGNTGTGQYVNSGTESAPSVSPSKANIGVAGGIAGGTITFGPNGPTSDANSFTSLFAKDPTTQGTAANNFVGNLGGDNPLQTMPGNTFTLDLWKDTTTSSSTTGWIYQGDLAFDFSGATPTLTWDASPVPEPSAASLCIGAGFLALAYRKFRRKA